MKKLVLVFIILCILTGCTPDYHEIAYGKVEEYIISLDQQDLDKQLEVLEQFELHAEYYQENFLSYVESAEIISIESAYEDDFILIMRGEFNLRFKSDYRGSDRLRAGDNRVIRYFTFYKMEDMALKEILDKLIK